MTDNYEKELDQIKARLKKTADNLHAQLKEEWNEKLKLQCSNIDSEHQKKLSSLLKKEEKRRNKLILDESKLEDSRIS